MGMTPKIHETAWIAPNAVVLGNVEIGAEASVWFGAVIRGDDLDNPIVIGARSNVQDNAVVHVSAKGSTVIGEGVTIGHAATVESCRIGSGSLVGMNAVILTGAELGPRCLVAAGALVKEGMKVPGERLLAGVPARSRELTEGARAWVQRGADHYVKLSRTYLEGGLVPVDE